MQGVGWCGLCLVVMPTLYSVSGSVEVYVGDEATGEWNLSHTLQFTRRQFPGKCQFIVIWLECFQESIVFSKFGRLVIV